MRGAIRVVKRQWNSVFQNNNEKEQVRRGRLSAGGGGRKEKKVGSVRNKENLNNSN